MSVTIRDIAQVAGVSASTVSRVFSLPEMVSIETRETVEAVARSMGYTPNRAARGLITGRTGNFAVLVPDLVNPFYPGIVKGVQLQSDASDYSVYIADTGDSEGELRLARDLANQTDGLVLCSSQLSEAELQSLAETTAVVLLNRAVTGIPSVTFDNRDCIRQALGHLKALGHRHIAWVGGPSTSWSSATRTTAIHEESEAAGLQLTDIGSFPPRFDGGVFAADLVLASEATAVIAYNDIVALGVINRLRARNVAVPDDFSVVGIDGSLMGEISSPALTSVSLPLERAGRTCVHVLLQLLDRAGGSQPDLFPVLPAQLMVRGSTGVPTVV